MIGGKSRSFRKYAKF